MNIETITATQTELPPTAVLLEATFSKYFLSYLNMLDKVPGGLILLRYIKSSYRNDPIRSLIELFLILFATHYFFSAKKKENKSDLLTLSKREVDELIDDWEPAPLVENVTEAEKWRLDDLVVKGQNSAHVELAQFPNLGKVINLSSLDFLDFNESPRMKAAAKETINSAGVGACGPPNFYGSQDVHVRLEEDLASYLKTEQAIIYGQDVVTPGSVIPAFLKRGDLAVVDSGVNQAIQKALIVSRCDIEWYDHNDIDHLHQILSELEPVLKQQKPLRRRFIVTEGLFARSGEMVKLPEIVELKNKFKYRLFLDESLSIGTVGEFGRGVPEHFNISRDEISITIGSLAGAFSSSGGFCAGVRPMIQHQRINSNAYVFSAALPPFSAKVASEAIHTILEESSSGQSQVLHSLHDKVQHSYKKLTTLLSKSKYFEVSSCSDSPIIHLSFRDEFRAALELPLAYGDLTLLKTGKPSRKVNIDPGTYNLECFILQKIIDGLLADQHALINRSRIVFSQEMLPINSPHLLVHINNGVSIEELDFVIDALPAHVNKVCSALESPSHLTNLYQEMVNY